MAPHNAAGASHRNKNQTGRDAVASAALNDWLPDDGFDEGMLFNGMPLNG
jgi:hypothetical protein